MSGSQGTVVKVLYDTIPEYPFPWWQCPGQAECLPEVVMQTLLLVLRHPEESLHPVRRLSHQGLKVTTPPSTRVTEMSEME